MQVTRGGGRADEARGTMTPTRRRRGALLMLLPLLGLGACAVTPPAGPMILATPPQGKELGRFQQEDAFCRQQAFGATGGISPQQAAGNAAVGSAAVGTALGAAAGALIGSASGAAGAGAAIGAGTGLLAGSAVGANSAYASSAAMQQAYDVAYAQCMTGYGNTVQAGVLPPGPGYAAGAVPYVTPYTTPYPPAGYGWWGPGYYYGAPSVTLGFGVYRGWGWGGYRPWYYGRPYFGRPYYGRPYGYRRW